MHARSALFDLYGDHLRSRGGQAPVAALVQILAPLGITAPAVRTAISRMVRQGWLEPTRLAGGRGYLLTDRARQRLDDAAARIYGTRDTRWSGTWDLLVVDPLPERSTRDRVRSGLGFLGYAALTESTWISPFVSAEAEDLLLAERARFSRFEARNADPRALARTAWDLGQLGASYASWHEDASKLVADAGSAARCPDLEGAAEQAFALRSQLVHEWRKFLFTDPGLPEELLPRDWPGHDAATFFAEEASRLLPAASDFVARCLAQDIAVQSETDGAQP